MVTRIVPPDGILFIEHTDSSISIVTTHAAYTMFKGSMTKIANGLVKVRVDDAIGSASAQGEITRSRGPDCFEFDFVSTKGDRRFVWLIKPSVYVFLPTWFTDLFTP